MPSWVLGMIDFKTASFYNWFKINLFNSGAGKTTLLNVLNHRNSKDVKVDGTIKINGEQVSSEIISKRSGYVQQTDVFIGTMTVKEHLSFIV